MGDEGRSEGMSLGRTQGGRRPVLAICGGGNAGHALAVVASSNFDGDIDWLVGSEQKADLLRRAISIDGLRSTGVITGQANRLRRISSDPEAVIPDADVVMIVVPAFVHGLVLSRIKPYVSDTTTIGCLPTRGGFEFQAAELAPTNRHTRRRLFGLQTLPWSTRVVTPGKLVNIGAAKAEAVLAALPASDGGGLAADLSQVLGTNVVPTEGFLNLTLGNPGQFIHPGLMYGHFGSWRGDEYDESTIPMLYAHATDEIGQLVEDLSDEAIAVARAIEQQSGNAVSLHEVIPVHDWLVASYGHVTDDPSTVATCFRTGPIQARVAPMVEVRPGRFVPNYSYRYLTEDVPFGLVVTRALADLVGVETPTIDEVIRWGQVAMQKQYLIDGQLTGRDAQDLPLPQRHGARTLEDLLDWYNDESAAVALSEAHARRW
jgi:hypothetical protein